MTDIRRTHAANHQKIQEAAKKRSTPTSPSGPRSRKSPAGRRLDALRERKGTTDE